MKATELVGKNAIRTEPVFDLCDSGLFGGYGVAKRPNYLYTTEPVKILKATESHIICEIKAFDGTTRERILNCQFCDDNWIDYNELMEGVE